MQREMPFLAPCKPPSNAPDALVRRIETDAQAERFCAVTGSRLLIQVRALREALAEIRGQMDAAETIRRFAAELRRAA